MFPRVLTNSTSNIAQAGNRRGDAASKALTTNPGSLRSHVTHSPVFAAAPQNSSQGLFSKASVRRSSRLFTQNSSSGSQSDVENNKVYVRVCVYRLVHKLRHRHRHWHKARAPAQAQAQALALALALAQAKAQALA